MKYLKFISICLMASFAMSISAAVTAKATISVQGDEGKKAAEITLTQDDTAAANFGDPNNAPYIAGGAQLTPGFYAVNGSNKYMKVVLPSLNNLKVKFVANAYETAYTMSFSGVTGEITLANADTAFVIDATKDYKFTCEKSATVEFTINPVTGYNRKGLTVGNWGTICLPYASSAIEGATMYEVLGYDAAKGVALGEFVAAQQMVAGTPYVFKATATELNVTYTGDAVADTVVVKGGFIGSFAGMDVEAGNYIIYNNMLYEAAEDCSIAANRAYFDIENMTEYQAAPGRKVVFFGGKGATTGMEALEAAPAMNGKMILNGRMVIVKDGKMFNAQGAQL